MPRTAADVNEAMQSIWPEVNSRCVDLGPDFAVAEVILGEFRRPGGFIPGPAQFQAADVALWYLVFGATGRIEPMALTTELSIRFLRPGVGEQLFARATLDRQGRTSVVGTVKVWADDNEDRPCSVAQGSYALPRS